MWVDGVGTCDRLFLRCLKQRSQAALGGSKQNPDKGLVLLKTEDGQAVRKPYNKVKRDAARPKRKK
jgi:hypothetical protein